MKSSNIKLTMMFAVALMFMGMAGLPFEFLGKDKPSPHLVVGLRLAFVGIMALAVGIITGYRNPLKHEFNRADVKDWLIFVALAVIGVNCTLTYALYLLDDRMAMAVMFVFIGIIFVGHHPGRFVAWLAAGSAIAGTTLLAVYGAHDQDISKLGIILAAIGGVALGFMFFKKRLMPKNIDSGLALGSAFLLGGLLMIAVSVVLAPLDQPLNKMPNLVFGMMASALMTVLGWLMLGYFADKMSGAQKSGAASLEPIGAATTQGIVQGWPMFGELVGVIFLVFSASVAMFLAEKSENDGEASVPK